MWVVTTSDNLLLVCTHSIIINGVLFLFFVLTKNELYFIIND